MTGPTSLRSAGYSTEPKFSVPNCFDCMVATSRSIGFRTTDDIYNGVSSRQICKHVSGLTLAQESGRTELEVQIV